MTTVSRKKWFVLLDVDRCFSLDVQANCGERVDVSMTRFAPREFALVSELKWTLTGGEIRFSSGKFCSTKTGLVNCYTEPKAPQI